MTYMYIRTPSYMHYVVIIVRSHTIALVNDYDFYVATCMP